jgi:hypothetical protein
METLEKSECKELLTLATLLAFSGKVDESLFVMLTVTSIIAFEIK